MDANQLSVEQLASIRENLQQELQHLSTSYEQLRQARIKFNDCGQSVKQVSEHCKDGKEILVPLTSSIYVQGKVIDPSKFIVDVGTDYFVEKSSDDTVKFFNRKVETLNKNLVDLEKLVNEKANALQAMERILTQKLSEARTAQTQAAQSAASSSA